MILNACECGDCKAMSGLTTTLTAFITQSALTHILEIPERNPSQEIQVKVDEIPRCFTAVQTPSRQSYFSSNIIYFSCLCACTASRNVTKHTLQSNLHAQCARLFVISVARWLCLQLQHIFIFSAGYSDPTEMSLEAANTHNMRCCNSVVLSAVLQDAS